MLFNSIDYLLFLPITFVFYWFVFKKSSQLQNVLILTASYVFYGWWDWRFLALIAFTTVVDYFIGLRIHQAEDDKNRKRWLWLSVGTNLGLLGFFKYYNFFVDSWVNAWSGVGVNMDPYTLNIILPVGISFYTFQTLSYSLDINKRQIEPTKDFVAFAVFVSFFPQLVAGPIERAANFLPQVLKNRTFSYNQAKEGTRLILWGMFKKIVIADTLGPIVNKVFGNYDVYPGLTLVIAVVYFSFQVYCDFSGYSDIAIGTAKLFGFELMSNFKYPFFSRSIAEFWRRFHVSLSTWLNDYLFLPLAIKFRYWGKHGLFLALFLTFAISGLWHGAGWNYVIYGAVHGLYFIPTVYWAKLSFISSKTVESSAFEKPIPSLKDVSHMLIIFSMYSFSLIFFRAEDVGAACGYIGQIFTSGVPQIIHPVTLDNGLIYLGYIGLFVIIEWLMRKDERAVFNFKFKYSDHMLFPLLIFIIIIHINVNQSNAFIYFQF